MSIERDDERRAIVEAIYDDGQWCIDDCPYYSRFEAQRGEWCRRCDLLDGKAGAFDARHCPGFVEPKYNDA